MKDTDLVTDLVLALMVSFLAEVHSVTVKVKKKTSLCLFLLCYSQEIAHSDCFQ